MSTWGWPTGLVHLVLFLQFCHRHHHALFPNNVDAQTMWQNNQFGMEAAALMAPMPTRMLIVTLLVGYCWLPGIKLYIFLRRSQPTNNPQHPSMHCDLNGQQRLPWCPTPGANTDNSFPECCQIVVCGGAGSGEPWWLWEDSGQDGWWGTL